MIHVDLVNKANSACLPEIPLTWVTLALTPELEICPSSGA